MLYSVPSKNFPDRSKYCVFICLVMIITLHIRSKDNRASYIAEQIVSCDSTGVAKTLGFQDLTPFQEW